MDEDDFEISYYRDDQIDLNELLREQFYLALPMKPLCREDCRGLCPQCGTSEYQHVRLRAHVGRPQACSAQRTRPEPRVVIPTTRTCLIRNVDTPRREPPNGARTMHSPATGLCPQCHEPKAPHRVCPHCGYYRQRPVRPVDEVIWPFVIYDS